MKIRKHRDPKTGKDGQQSEVTLQWSRTYASYQKDGKYNSCCTGGYLMIFPIISCGKGDF